MAPAASCRVKFTLDAGPGIVMTIVAGDLNEYFYDVTGVFEHTFDAYEQLFAGDSLKVNVHALPGTGATGPYTLSIELAPAYGRGFVGRRRRAV